jgi:hypothetical protein
MHNESLTEGAEKVSQDTLKVICELTQKEFSPEAISYLLGLKVQTVLQVIARENFGSKHLNQEGSQCKQDPTYIYSYLYNTGQLHMTNLVTGEHSSHRVPSFTFTIGCCWSEVPGGSLLITGGEEDDLIAGREVVRIDTRREFAVAHCAPMLTPRLAHAAVYHTPHLYILGDENGSSKVLSECERYVCAENRWEALPPLLTACMNTSGVVVERSLYALGGNDGSRALDIVQRLSLDCLSWELMQFRLPFAGCCIPCFKLKDTEVYLVVGQTLCSFTALEVRPLKSLTQYIQSLFGASYYRRGILYCSSYSGGARSLELGSITN